MSTEVNVSEFINNEFLQNALKSYGNGADIQVIDYTVTSATAKGDNYTSEMFRVGVKLTRDGKHETKSLIVKLAPSVGMKKEMV